MADVVQKDVHEAFRQVCYEFGVEDLAGKMGVPTGTLYNKCNINETSHHKPTLTDAVLVTHLTNDKRIIRAFAHSCAGVYFELPDLSNVTTGALLSHILKIARENGDFHKAIDKSMEKNGISKNEYIQIEKEGHELIAAILESLVRMKEMSGGAR